MQHIHPWEANTYSASHEIPRILWNPKIHYRIHNSQPLVLTQRQTNQVHVAVAHFFQGQF